MTTLRDVLEEARDLGFLGPGPVDDQIHHSAGFVDALLMLGEPPGRGLDLGSGGGIPGLVLATRFEDTQWVLLDASQRRTDFLTEAIRRLGLSHRVSVVRGRAEEAARRLDLRHEIEVVFARGFGPPGVTAECGVGFLREGGRLIVSEPPEAEVPRWPASGLAVLGLRMGPTVDAAGHFQVLVAERLCDDRFPRRAPHKRPLF